MSPRFVKIGVLTVAVVIAIAVAFLWLRPGALRDEIERRGFRAENLAGRCHRRSEIAATAWRSTVTKWQMFTHSSTFTPFADTHAIRRRSRYSPTIFRSRITRPHVPDSEAM